MSNTPIQKVFFGSPGTGKSYLVQQIAQKDLKTEKQNIIKTVFHPEYSYGDFMGKLLPLSDDHGKPTYQYYAGHFLKALAKSYQNIINNPQNPEHVVLVIDELNRGNSSSIFGTIFQLLDRENDGWSSYDVMLTDIEIKHLIELIGYKFSERRVGTNIYLDIHYNEQSIQDRIDPSEKIKTIEEHLSNQDYSENYKQIIDLIHNKNVKLPPNLSILATMNTSDESIFYMDSAFKRRWDWEAIEINHSKHVLSTVKIEKLNLQWTDFIDKLNQFIVSNHKFIRKVEDKQIGYFFIKHRNNVIALKDIQNKLMFFLWDNVFARDKKILEEKLKLELRTFNDFSKNTEQFINAIIK